MFGKITHDDLSAKIRKLDSKVSASQSLFGSFQPHQWNDVFELIKEIQEDFMKGIRYPSKAERDEAWQTFFNLREDAYRLRREQFQEKSQQHYNEIGRYLRDAYWNALEDEIGDVFTLGLMRTTKEDMKRKGQQLREAGQLLSKLKHEMTNEHKAEIHERIVKTRENHDVFWERHREYQKEKQQIYEQKKQSWEEGQTRRQQAKERIAANIDKNKESLRKAEDALDRQRQHRRKLEDDIASAYSDSFRERAEGWLDECNDKISDIEESIQRLESWIQEGRDKLNSFH
jgi:chromosome segregation ATPase